MNRAMLDSVRLVYNLRVIEGKAYMNFGFLLSLKSYLKKLNIFQILIFKYGL